MPRVTIVSKMVLPTLRAVMGMDEGTSGRQHVDAIPTVDQLDRSPDPLLGFEGDEHVGVAGGGVAATAAAGDVAQGEAVGGGAVPTVVHGVGGDGGGAVVHVDDG